MSKNFYKKWLVWPAEGLRDEGKAVEAFKAQDAAELVAMDWLIEDRADAMDVLVQAVQPGASEPLRFEVEIEIDCRARPCERP